MSDWSTIKKMIWLRRTAIGTTYTLTGPVVSFSTFRSAPLAALTAAIVPVQSGTGDPAPDNVRPITGYTGATIYVSPTIDPGDATTYAVDWTSDAGTVYAGTLDVLTGLLTVDRIKIALANLTWQRRASYRFSSTLSSAADVTVAASAQLCDRLSVGYVNGYSTATTHGTVYLYKQSSTTQTTTIYLNISDSIDSKADLDTWLASNPVELVYWLATPQTYQLTPTQVVSTLVGENNIWASTGDVTVTYRG